MKKLTASIFLFLLIGCTNDSHDLLFLMANLSDYGEATDITIEVDGTKVCCKHFTPTNIADSYQPLSVSLPTGTHHVVLSSAINNIRNEFDMELKSDTGLIIEYRHNDTLVFDSLGRDIGLKEGGKWFFTMYTSVDH